MSPPAIISPLRARLALKASRIFQQNFVCRQCLHQRAKATTTSYPAPRQTPYLNAFRRNQSSAASHEQTPPPTSPLGALSQNIRRPEHKADTRSSESSSFPEVSDKSVAYFLLISATSVFGLIVFGGLTRLTESGLSITEWRPLTGTLPPTSPAAWDSEFARYKATPEARMLNPRMTLEEFEQIYWMEWGHRLWGRVVGLTFLGGTGWFLLRRKVSKGMAGRLEGISGLIGFQGVVGWWMVKSGLTEDLWERGSHPRVSQYRLTVHLGTAFVAYLAMVWNGLSILREHRLVGNPEEGARILEALQRPELRRFKRLVGGLGALVFVTAMGGALVAGLDAGMIYNNFPWMGEGWLPPKRELLDPFYSHTPEKSDLLWRNMLENPVLVQLDHRILAISTFSAVLGLWSYSRFNPRVRAALPTEARKAMLGVVHLVSLQVALGISTLWFLVPTWLGAAHQAGALALLTGVTVLGSRVWVPRRTFRLVQQALQQRSAGKGGVYHLANLSKQVA